MNSKNKVWIFIGVMFVISNVVTALLSTQIVKNSLNIKKVSDFIEMKDESGYIFLREASDPSETLRDPKIDKCIIFGGIGVDLKSKDSEGYTVKTVLKEGPAAKILKPGDKIISDLSIIRGRVGDPVKVYYKTRKNILLPMEDKEAFMTLKPIKKCYLK